MERFAAGERHLGFLWQFHCRDRFHGGRLKCRCKEIIRGFEVAIEAAMAARWPLALSCGECQRLSIVIAYCQTLG
jgi:ABC-type dipeptide/oligopeptide/nickel transport system ATPase subunit